MSQTSPVPTPPGWFPDPGGSPALRYWDGRHWTDQLVAPERPMDWGPDPITTLPIQAAVTALIVTLVALTANRYLIQWLARYHWPIATYSFIAILVGYGPLLLCCVFVSRKWGTRNFGDDFGFRFKPVDLGWGPVTYVASFAAQIVIALILIATKLPYESNTKGIGGHSGNHAYIVSLAIVAVVCAPLVEELVFRGVVLRGFCSAMPVWIAIGLQGVLFGSAHFDPIRGVKNIGLILALSAIGVVFGGAAYLLRRLAPTMIAHALVNTIALIVTLYALHRGT